MRVVAVVERVPPSTRESSPKASPGPMSHNNDCRLMLRWSPGVCRVSFTFPSTTRYMSVAGSPTSKSLVPREHTMASLNARSLLADVVPNADRNGWATAVVTTFVIDGKFLSSGPGFCRGAAHVTPHLAA